MKRAKKVTSPVNSGIGIIQSVSVPVLASVQETFNARSKKTSEAHSVSSSTKGAKSRNIEPNNFAPSMTPIFNEVAVVAEKPKNKTVR